MGKIYTTHSVEETKSLGKKLAGETSPGTLLCLLGDLGSGKTTFAQGFLEGMGALRPYVSPTFVIMKQYDLSKSSARGVERVYHADAYRVEVKDFISLGFAEWCADLKGVVILEWPERVQKLIPSNAIIISFRSLSETAREMRFVPFLE